MLISTLKDAFFNQLKLDLALCNPLKLVTSCTLTTNKKHTLNLSSKKLPCPKQIIESGDYNTWQRVRRDRDGIFAEVRLRVSFLNISKSSLTCHIFCSTQYTHTHTHTHTHTWCSWHTHSLMVQHIHFLSVTEREWKTLFKVVCLSRAV